MFKFSEETYLASCLVVGFCAMLLLVALDTIFPIGYILSLIVGGLMLLFATLFILYFILHTYKIIRKYYG